MLQCVELIQISGNNCGSEWILFTFFFLFEKIRLVFLFELFLKTLFITHDFIFVWYNIALLKIRSLFYMNSLCIGEWSMIIYRRLYNSHRNSFAFSFLSYLIIHSNWTSFHIYVLVSNIFFVLFLCTDPKCIFLEIDFFSSPLNSIKFPISTDSVFHISFIFTTESTYHKLTTTHIYMNEYMISIKWTNKHK